jgi:hypothetical protein
MVTILILITLAPLSFFAGMHWHKIIPKPKPKCQCPFNNACTSYDPVHTHAAIKRVLQLLLDNNLPPEQIKKIIQKSL